MASNSYFLVRLFTFYVNVLSKSTVKTQIHINNIAECRAVVETVLKI